MPLDADRLREYRSRPENRQRAVEISRQWREDNRDRKRETDRRYRISRRSTLATRQRKYRLRQYGLTIEDYEGLFDAQGGVCAICLTPPFEGKALVVDHDHETGAVRGLLHHTCNTAIGLLDDSPEIVARAAAYLAATAL